MRFLKQDFVFLRDLLFLPLELTFKGCPLDYKLLIIPTSNSRYWSAEATIANLKYFEFLNGIIRSHYFSIDISHRAAAPMILKNCFFGENTLWSPIHPVIGYTIYKEFELETQVQFRYKKKSKKPSIF